MRPLRPATCPTCQGTREDTIASRPLPCAPCNGRGFLYLDGHDAWAGYRAYWNIEVSPQRLAVEEALDEAGLAPS